MFYVALPLSYLSHVWGRGLESNQRPTAPNAITEMSSAYGILCVIVTNSCLCQGFGPRPGSYLRYNQSGSKGGACSKRGKLSYDLVLQSPSCTYLYASQWTGTRVRRNSSDIVDVTGIEPATSVVQARRSPN